MEEFIYNFAEFVFWVGGVAALIFGVGCIIGMFIRHGGR